MESCENAYENSNEYRSPTGMRFDPTDLIITGLLGELKSLKFPGILHIFEVLINFLLTKLYSDALN